MCGQRANAHRTYARPRIDDTAKQQRLPNRVCRCLVRASAVCTAVILVVFIVVRCVSVRCESGGGGAVLVELESRIGVVKEMGRAAPAKLCEG